MHGRRNARLGIDKPSVERRFSCAFFATPQSANADSIPQFAMVVLLRLAACSTPLLIGLTSRCFAHRARASYAPFEKGEPFGKCYTSMKLHLPKASFFPKGKGRWRGVSRDGGIGTPPFGTA